MTFLRFYKCLSCLKVIRNGRIRKLLTIKHVLMREVMIMTVFGDLILINSVFFTISSSHFSISFSFDQRRYIANYLWESLTSEAPQSSPKILRYVLFNSRFRYLKLCSNTLFCVLYLAFARAIACCSLRRPNERLPIFFPIRTILINL